MVSDFLNSKTDNNDEKKYVKEVTWQIIKILLSDNYTQQKLDSLLLLLSRLYNSIENENDLEKITQFLNDQAKIYLKNDENNFFSEKIIMFTLNKKFITLIKKCSKSLLNIMNSFFIVDDKAKQDITLGFRNIYSQNCHLLNFDYSNKFKIQVFEFLLLFSYFNFHEFLR
ncbi:MAG: hypothetical protein MJ219_00420 [Mycoplasmoidaceae bacterium]|nr:hypothetical protein [Mycoplasmoidaceae bacterium]